MKGVFVILDGIGDLPHRLLNGKTPLEAAKTPNLDYLASHGKLGYCYPVKPKFIPESDEAIVSLFGNSLMSSTRGQLEAKGADLELKRGDIALRVNIGTVDENKNVVDRRAGRTLTSAEARTLSKALKQIKLPCSFVFEPTVQHRAAFVMKGGFSDSVTPNDLTYSQGKSKSFAKLSRFRPTNDDENSAYTANLLNEFVDKAYEILDKHPVNEARRKKGLLPANYLFMRGAGTSIPKLKQYKKWVSIGYMPLEIGFSKLSGMDVATFRYPALKGIDAYTNLWDGIRKVCKFTIKNLKKNHKKYDYAYVHIKETDLPGHDNKPKEKKAMIEYLDLTLFDFLRKVSKDGAMKIVVTGDHSTPCKMKAHSAHAVPVLYYDNSPKKDKRFTEKQARYGSLGKILGSDLMKVVGFKR